MSAALCRTLPHSAALSRTRVTVPDLQCGVGCCVDAQQVWWGHVLCRFMALQRMARVTVPDLQCGVGCCVDAQQVRWGHVLCRFMALQRMAHSPFPPQLF